MRRGYDKNGDQLGLKKVLTIFTVFSQSSNTSETLFSVFFNSGS